MHDIYYPGREVYNVTEVTVKHISKQDASRNQTTPLLGRMGNNYFYSATNFLIGCINSETPREIQCKEALVKKSAVIKGPELQAEQKMEKESTSPTRARGSLSYSV